MTNLQKLGRSGMERHVIAARHIDAQWSDKYKMALADAWEKQDAGTHTMCQGRNGDFIVQYLIPKKRLAA